jgi:hypothetical protein
VQHLVRVAPEREQPSRGLDHLRRLTIDELLGDDLVDRQM